MAGKIDWDSQIGRRVRLRDLYVLSTVVQSGSMAKAALQLGISQPSVSEVIADLEFILGVRLLDRSSQGVTPTLYGSALLKRSRVAFDELKQAIRDIETLADPTAGEVRIGCPESIASSILPAILHRFSEQHPCVSTDVDAGPTHTMIKDLFDRSLDLVIARGGQRLADDSLIDQLNVEVLFDDKLVVVSGKETKWARRRAVSLTDLSAERWILSAPGTWNYMVVEEAFREHGLPLPKVSLNTLSIHLRTSLLGSGRYIAVLPHSVVRSYGKHFALKILPIHLPARPWPVTIVTLKNRSLGPVVERFMACTREVTKPLAPYGSRSSA
jgi:DNA-binding transcriptional LysR family regulator